MAIDGMPDFYDMVYVDADGNLTSEAHLYNDQFNQVVNLMLNQLNQISVGLPAPNATTAEITAFGADTAIPLGMIWFNTDTSKLQVKTAASTIETITSA